MQGTEIPCIRCVPTQDNFLIKKLSLKQVRREETHTKCEIFSKSARNVSGLNKVMLVQSLQIYIYIYIDAVNL